MKRFIDDNGTFELKVPSTWKYSLKDNKIHTFQEYEIWKSDAFQLSINPLETQEKKDTFHQSIKLLPVVKIDDIDFYQYPDSIGEGFITKAWMRLYNDKSVLFTLTHPVETDPELDSRTIEEKIETVYNILQEFKLIEDGQSVNAINSYRFDMFLQGVGATALILNKAVANKAFIEATCILASQIDALLRIGIILKKQINNSDSNIELEWIYQGLADKKKSEKDIYKKALDLGIIDQPIRDELYSLYEDRNRVIHRFIISEITLAEVEEIAYKYYQKQQSINKIIYDLESEQIRLNVGMTRTDNTPLTEEKHLHYVEGKIGKQNYFDEKE